MRQLLVTLVLAVLLLSPPASAASVLRANAARGFDSTLDAPLTAGIVVFDGSNLAFSLVADRISGQVEETRNNATINNVAITPEGHRNVRVDVASVHVQEIQAVAGGHMLLTAHTAQAHGTMDAVIPGIALDDLTVASKASVVRQPTVLPTAGALRIDATAGMVRIHGTFDLVFWAANFTLDGNVTTRIQTGLERQSSSPGLPPLTRGVEATIGREAYLTIENGTLEIPAQSIQMFALGLSLAGTTPTSSLGLDDATGTLAILGRSLNLENEDVVATGKTTLSLAPDRDQLSAELTGRPEAVTVDGVSVQPLGRDLTWIWWLAAVAIMMLVLIAVAYHRASQKNLRVLDALMGRQDFGAAMVVARRLQRFQRYREEGTVAEAICNVKLGRLGEAKRVLARPLHGRPKGGRLFLQARIAAEEGRRGEAVSFLADCLQQEPGYATDAAADPFLGPVVDAARQRNAANVGGYA